jgi:hypothetical protein
MILPEDPRFKNLLKSVESFWGKITFDELRNLMVPNKYQILKSKRNGFNANILIKNDYRFLEGLIHELLHLELYKLGYPYFVTNDSKINPQWIIDTNNGIQHTEMLEMYLELRFKKNKFFSQRTPLNSKERETELKINSLKNGRGVEDYTQRGLEFYESEKVSVSKYSYSKMEGKIIRVFI